MTVSWIPRALIRSGCWKNTLLSAKSLLEKENTLKVHVTVKRSVSFHKIVNINVNE